MLGPRRAHHLGRRGCIRGDGPEEKGEKTFFLWPPFYSLSIYFLLNQHWQCLLVAGSGSKAVLLVFAKVALVPPPPGTGSSDKCTLLRGQALAAQSPVSKLTASAPAPQTVFSKIKCQLCGPLLQKPLISNNSTLSSLLFNP